MKVKKKKKNTALKFTKQHIIQKKISEFKDERLSITAYYEDVQCILFTESLI